MPATGGVEGLDGFAIRPIVQRAVGHHTVNIEYRQFYATNTRNDLRFQVCQSTPMRIRSSTCTAPVSFPWASITSKPLEPILWR